VERCIEDNEEDNKSDRTAKRADSDRRKDLPRKGVY
jgi:hypothetical protein